MKFTSCIYAASALVVLAGCSAENDPAVNGGGKISPTISVDSGVVEATDSRSTDDMTLSPDEFSLTLSSATGAVNRTWDKATDFPSSELWPIGEYTLSASYGNINNEGFELPCYAGETKVAVTEGAVATAAVTCTLSNSLISINTSEAFRGYFTSYSVQVVTSLDHTIGYPNDEIRPLYVKPGSVSLIIDVTKPNGVHATFTPSAMIEAEARHHYRMNLDVNSGEMGQGVIVVNFDNTVTTEDIVIDLSDELMNSPAPEIFAIGFDPTSTLDIPDEERSAKVAMMVQARAGLSGLRLSVNAPSLEAKGFPTECDLMSLTPEQTNIVRQLGLECDGVWSNTDRIAVVSFSKLLRNVTDMHSTFTLTAIDKYSKSSNPMTLSVQNLSVNTHTIE